MTETLTWKCDVCRRPVADHTGSIYVPFAEIQDAGVVTKAWIPSGPHETAHWRVNHQECRQDQDESGYGFGVNQIRTMGQALAWTIHLMGKSWVGDSDWEAFIYDRVLRPANVNTLG